MKTNWNDIAAGGDLTDDQLQADKAEIEVDEQTAERRARWRRAADKCVAAARRLDEWRSKNG